MKHRPNTAAASAEDYFRKKLFCPFLESLINQLSDRFSSKTKLCGEFEVLLPDQCARKGPQVDRFEKLFNNFSTTFKSNNFDFSLQQSSHHYLKWARRWSDCEDSLCPKNFVEALKLCNKDVYPSVNVLLEIASILPVSTATVERSFSRLKILKTHLRSTTGEDRLNGLALMSVYSDFKVNIDSVLKRFATDKNRRLVII